MKAGAQILLKFFLLLIIVLFALFNYKFISFDKGISKTSMENMSVREVLTAVTGITNVEYYEMPFMKKIKESNDSVHRPSNYQSYDYIYRVYIVTNNDAYLLKATQDDIDAFNVLGIFSKTLKPNKITPIPYYVEIIIGFLVLVIPFGRPKKETKGDT